MFEQHPSFLLCQIVPNQMQYHLMHKISLLFACHLENWILLNHNNLHILPMKKNLSRVH